MTFNEAVKKCHVRSSMPTTDELRDEIFDAVQMPQGKAHISDGIDALKTPEDLFECVRFHLSYAREAVEVIEQFLLKYGELKEKNDA